jgi:hypothetical protein
VGAKQPLLGRSRAPLGEIGNFVSNVASRAVEKFAGGDPRCVDTAALGPGAAAVGPRKRARQLERVFVSATQAGAPHSTPGLTRHTSGAHNSKPGEAGALREVRPRPLVPDDGLSELVAVPNATCTRLDAHLRLTRGQRAMCALFADFQRHTRALLAQLLP